MQVFQHHHTTAKMCVCITHNTQKLFSINLHIHHSCASRSRIRHHHHDDVYTLTLFGSSFFLLQAVVAHIPGKKYRKLWVYTQNNRPFGHSQQTSQLENNFPVMISSGLCQFQAVCKCLYAIALQVHFLRTLLILSARALGPGSIWNLLHSIDSIDTVIRRKNLQDAINENRWTIYISLKLFNYPDEIKQNFDRAFSSRCIVKATL